MARVRQFAKDLGINYNQAKDLINKGRSRKDGGSQILENTMSVTKKKFGGATLTSKDAKKINKMNKKPKDPMGDRFGKDGDLKFRETAKKPYHPKHNPDQYHPTLNPDGKKGKPKVAKKQEGGLGMQSVKYGLDNNPAITAADPKAKFIAANKKAGGGMPKMPKYRDGGVFRGCGAQVKGKKFKGVF